jgi:succinoglycan biosynthesis protein ExoM
MTSYRSSQHEHGQRLPVAVAVCTHRRNEPLARALRGVDRALIELEATSGRRGLVVVVDDNPDGAAESVVKQFHADTGRDTEYRRSGKQNISVARNLAIETGFETAEFVALLDDDCVPSDDWLINSFAVMDELSADVVTGPKAIRPPDDCPRWLLEHPFFTVQQLYPDRSVPPYGATTNALLRSQWFLDNAVRFEPHLGVVGGEDMVFFNAAKAAGANHRYAAASLVHEVLPAERVTLGYQLYTWTWFGNTEAVTNLESGQASRPRLVLRAARRAMVSTGELGQRLVARRRTGGSVGVRYWATQVGRSVGLALGAFGLRIKHK